MVGAEEWMEQGSGKLKILGKLGIRGDLSFFQKVLPGLTKLQSLRVGLGFGNGTLNWASLSSSLTKLHLERRLQKPPRSEEFPKSIVKLCLRWSLMEKDDDIAALQSFQNLKVLWRVEEGALPTFAGLAIRFCRRLKKVPEGLQHVTTLRRLEISLMPQEFQGQLDWDKLKHKPSVSIDRDGHLHL
ncbi:hypothetical protein ACLOJK_015388 [Asimina triloba]